MDPKPLYFLEPSPREAHVCVIMCLKTILTHRFTSTLIISGDHFSSKIGILYTQTETNTH